MSKIKYFLIIMFSILLFGCANKLENIIKVIYATNFEINNFETNYCVGDSVNIFDINFTILPTNATVIPKITSDNSNIAKIELGKIKFVGEGSCNIVFSVESAKEEFLTVTKQVNVSNSGIKATSINFENNNVKLNYDETANNLLNILPINCSIKPIITYSVDNVINYNYLTGEITPVGIGTTIVTATIKNDKNNVITAKFSCEVTNFVYATMANPTINNEQNVTLETGYSGNINLNVIPNSYNMGAQFVCSNNLITINNFGEFIVGNKTGNGTIQIKLKTLTGYIEKKITFTIVKPETNLDVTLFYNNNEVTKYYTGVTYIAKVNTLNIDYNSVVFTGCNYTYVNSNIFEITFNNSGKINLGASYVYNLTSGNKTINYYSELNVYNPITDINFGLFNDETEIVLNNNTYNLFLIDSNYLSDAKTDNKFNSAVIKLSAKGINTLNSDLIVNVVGDAVAYNNYTISANKVGNSTIVVSSSDPLGFSKSYSVNVTEEKANNIIVSQTDVTMFLSESSFNLTYEVMPIYAYNKIAKVEASNNIVTYNNGLVTLNSVGTTTLTISLNNIIKTVYVTVLPEPNKIVASFNNNLISNNAELNMFKGVSEILSCYLYSDDTLINIKPELNIVGNSVTLNYNELTKVYSINAVTDGRSTVTFSYKNLVFSFSVIVKTENKILSATFENNSMEVNLFLTNVITPKINLQLENYNLEPTDELMLLSSNEAVAVINGNSITLLSIGNVTINIVVNNKITDSLALSIINKEIIEITNVNQFNSLQNKAYVLCCDLNFENFETIEAFNGEIDFNNYSVSNLKVPLFNTLNSSAVVKNLNFNSDIIFTDNNNTNFCLIANNNYGEINGVKFNNLSISINNLSDTSKGYLSIIANNNYGNIQNINFSNVVINENRNNATYSNSRFCGLTAYNYGYINNVVGNLEINNFVKVTGVADSCSGDINKIDLSLKIKTTEKFNGAGLIYSIANDNKITLSNINLQIELSGNVNISGFAGVIKNINSDVDLNNVTVKLNLVDNYSTESVALFCYLVSCNNVNVVNCGYYGINGYSAVIEGELNNLIEKQ